MNRSMEENTVLQLIASVLGLAADEPVAAAPHIETRRVRLDSRPRRCEQTYGPAYLAMNCSDGTVAIVLNAEAHSQYGALKPGSELTLQGQWARTSTPRLMADRVFHVSALTH